MQYTLGGISGSNKFGLTGFLYIENLIQPWPKLALSTFIRSKDGLAAVVYAPCTVKTMIGNANVAVTLETGYPYRDLLNFIVQIDCEAEFAIWLRMPEWAKEAVIKTPA